MGQWEEANREVARESRRREGQLFRLPRKTRNTTTEQHLDPARLDHLLALRELPEQTHAPDAHAVEREAKVSADGSRRPCPPASPLSQPMDLVLHIGQGKTGTSFYPVRLQNNRERLSQLARPAPEDSR